MKNNFSTNFLQKRLSQAPSSPGIYIFKDKKKKILYVGKAINLKKRLKFYLKTQPRLDLKTFKMLEKAGSVSWIEVKSEIEALLLEMNLIKQFKPFYNIVGRDDKRPLYVYITKSEFPKVLTGRLPISSVDYYGPFPSSAKLHQILKRLRRIFPYCSCRSPSKPCLFTRINLCNPCPATISSRDEKISYQKQIRRLKMFLSGKISQVLALLKKEMKMLSQSKNYEKAAFIRDQINAISELLAERPKISEYLNSKNLQPNLSAIQITALKKLLKIPVLFRIEGYDVSNLSGGQAAASMVVFEDGIPAPSKYRRFKIRLKNIIDDPAMMAEALARRLSHAEWEFPDFILVDGGKPQVGRAQKIIKQRGFKIKIVGLAKKNEEMIYNKEGKWQSVILPPEAPALNLLKAVRDEAHRFANNYHKFLRKSALTL